MVTRHSYSTVSLTSPWCAIHTVQRHTHFFISLIAESQYRHQSLVGRVIRFSTLLVNKLPVNFYIKMLSAHVLHPDVGDRSGSLARTALCTGYEPNFIQPQSNPNFISIADGDDEDLMTVESSQLGQAPIFPSAGRFFSSDGTGSPGAVHGEVPGQQQGHLHNTRNLVHEARGYWRSQSYNALHYQQEQFENSAQEHQLAAHEQLEIAATVCHESYSSAHDFQIPRHEK